MKNKFVTKEQDETNQMIADVIIQLKIILLVLKYFAPRYQKEDVTIDMMKMSLLLPNKPIILILKKWNQ